MEENFVISRYVLQYLKTAKKGQKIYIFPARQAPGIDPANIIRTVCVSDLEKLDQYRQLFEKIKNSDPSLEYSGAELIEYFNKIEQKSTNTEPKESVTI